MVNYPHARGILVVRFELVAIYRGLVHEFSERETPREPHLEKSRPATVYVN